MYQYSLIFFRDLVNLSESLYYQLQNVLEQRDDYVEVNNFFSYTKF